MKIDKSENELCGVFPSLLSLRFSLSLCLSLPLSVNDISVAACMMFPSPQFNLNGAAYRISIFRHVDSQVRSYRRNGKRPSLVAFLFPRLVVKPAFSSLSLSFFATALFFPAAFSPMHHQQQPQQQQAHRGHDNTTSHGANGSNANPVVSNMVANVFFFQRKR